MIIDLALESLLGIQVPRRRDLPNRELEICARLRSFREETKIPRTVFAAEAGLVGTRLINCELGLTPVSYGVFLAINRRFFLRPEWLVYGMGSQQGSEPFCDDGQAATVKDRELASSVCDRLFKTRFEHEAAEDKEEFLGEGGVLAWMKQTEALFRDEPNAFKRWPLETRNEFARTIATLVRAVYKDTGWDDLPPDIRELIASTKKKL